MTDFTIKTRTEEDFFKRGRQLGRAADRGERLPDRRVISFEDPADLMKLMTETRLAVFRAVKNAPGSITHLDERLHRDRSAVKRDVDEMERAGLVTITEKILPGHGRMKEGRAVAYRFRLQVDIA
jgi:predicted transcriptional regulator